MCYFLVSLSLLLLPGSVYSTLHEKNLIERLLVNYSLNVRPLRPNDVSPTEVKLALKLMQIFELEEKAQVLQSSVMVIQTWTDHRLSWNPSEEGNVEEVSITPEDIWAPDTVLMNNADKRYIARRLGMSSPIHVHFSGEITWFNNIIIKTNCKMQVRYFPFDEQFCPIRISAWTYTDQEMVLYEAGSKGCSQMNYTENSAWSLEDLYSLNSTVPARITVPGTKRAITYMIHLRRKSFYYFVYLTAPCLLTSFLMSMIFLLPPDCGERMVVGVTTLLALTVFFLLAAKNIPETSEDIPLMGRYYSLTIFEMAIALFLTAIVLRFHYSSSPVPKWVKRCILGKLASFVRIETPQNQKGNFKPKDEDTQSKTGEEFIDEIKKGPDEEKSGLVLMAERIIDESESSRQQDEWKLAAKVINRLFFSLYMIAVSLSVIGIFAQTPGFIISRPKKPTAL